MTFKTGSCRCGQTRWQFDAKPLWQCYCHCDDCRRNCSAPIVAWLGVPEDSFKWTGQGAKSWSSSPGVTRYMCESCGTPMGFEAQHYPGEMILYAATLDQPQDFAPQFHVNWESKLPWLEVHDDLPKYSGTLSENS